MKKFLLPVALGALFLTACTTKEIVREVSPTTVATTAPRPVVTNPPSNNPTSYDYQSYLDHVNSQSYAALTVSDGELIQAGNNVCTALDNGMSFGELVTFLQNEMGYMTDDDMTFMASVIAGAVVFLCPEYNAEMQAYLGANA